MPISTTLQPSKAFELRHEIEQLLEDLTPDSLMTMRQFAAFLQTQQDQMQPSRFDQPTNVNLKQKAGAELAKSLLQPWVAVAADDVLKLTAVLAPGYQGDALADTEAIDDKY